MEKVDTEFIIALRQAHASALHAILAVNRDLFERVQEAGIAEDYDQENDILHLWIGGPQPAISESVDGLLYLRVIPESSRIVGFELEHARQVMREMPAVSKLVHHLRIAGRRELPPREWMACALQEELGALAGAS